MGRDGIARDGRRNNGTGKDGIRKDGRMEGWEIGRTS